MSDVEAQAPRPVEVLLTCNKTNRVGRQELVGLPVPEPTRTHVPISHADVVERLVETLAFRHIAVAKDEYALTPDFQRMFGVMTLDVEHSGVRLALGIRNSHDKSFALGLTIGFRVWVCDNLMFAGDFQAVIARKHTTKFDLADTLSIAVDRVQRGFEPMRRQIDVWKSFDLQDGRAKSIIYAAFIEDGLPAPKHLAKVVHHNYFEPEHDEFQPRTMWSLQNAFTSAFKELGPIPQMKVTAKLAQFLERFSSEERNVQHSN